jgi:organic hydroperoxide reductase OsmC/OhrA
MSEHKAMTRWTQSGGDFLQKEYSRDHQVSFPNGQQLLGSAAVGYNGNPAGVDPEAMLTAAVSACHMLTFLALCAVKGFVVSEYEDDASGTLEKNSEGKMVVSQIRLQPRAVFVGEAPDSERLQMMHERAHKSCFISNSVRTVIEIHPRD